eukprot:16435153-Heterocapsa_arctica.AAC.1
MSAQDHPLSKDDALTVAGLDGASLRQTICSVHLAVEVAQPGASLRDCSERLARGVGIFVQEASYPTQRPIAAPLRRQSLRAAVRPEVVIEDLLGLASRVVRFGLNFGQRVAGLPFFGCPGILSPPTAAGSGQTSTQAET